VRSARSNRRALATVSEAPTPRVGGAVRAPRRSSRDTIAGCRRPPRAIDALRAAPYAGAARTEALARLRSGGVDAGEREQLVGLVGG